MAVEWSVYRTTIPSFDPATFAQADSWERFDIFAVSRLSGGRPLQAVTWYLMSRLGVVESLGLHRPSVLNFLRVRLPIKLWPDPIAARPL